MADESQGPDLGPAGSTAPRASEAAVRADDAVLADTDLLVTRSGRLGLIISLERELYVLRQSANRRRRRALFAPRPYAGVQLLSLRLYPTSATVYRLTLRSVQRNVMKSAAVRLLGTAEPQPVERLLAAVNIDVADLDPEVARRIGNLEAARRLRSVRWSSPRLSDAEVVAAQDAFAAALRRPFNTISLDQRC